MKTERSAGNMIGKTIEGFECSFSSSQAVMTFTDGTFATLGIDPGWEGDRGTIKPETLEVFDFGDERLIGLSVITKDELATMRAARDQQRRERNAVAERRQYDRLKAKFEAGEEKR